MSIDLSRVGVSGPLSARSRHIQPFCFAPTEEATIALSNPRLYQLDVIMPTLKRQFTATKARSPTLVGIIWKSA
jgi:hypothetical protein